MTLFQGFGTKIKKRQKMPENSQNGKTTATPVTVATHQESERKVYFKVGPMGKKAIFGQKMP